MKTTARPVTLVALATLSAIVLSGCSQADAQAVEDRYAVCVDAQGNYADLSQCATLDDGDLDNRDDYDAGMGMTTAGRFVLGAVAASLLEGAIPTPGQKAHLYVRTVPAEANLITPQGVLAPGTGDKDKHKAQKPTTKATPKTTPAPAKATPAKAQEKKQSSWKKSSSSTKKSSSCSRSSKR